MPHGKNNGRDSFRLPDLSGAAKQCEIAIPFPADNAICRRSRRLSCSTGTKLAGRLDSRVLVHQLRHLLQQTTLNASESGLRALIQRHLRKPSKTNIDRDKIDFLLVQYFALCAPAKVYHKQIELEDTAIVMKPVLARQTRATRVVRAIGENDCLVARFRSADMLKNISSPKGAK